jgi:hypothetical protein
MRDSIQQKDAAPNPKLRPAAALHGVDVAADRAINSLQFETSETYVAAVVKGQPLAVGSTLALLAVARAVEDMA